MYLFSPADNEYSALSKNEQSYIEFGVKQGYNSGYKCRIRKEMVYCSADMESRCLYAPTG